MVFCGREIGGGQGLAAPRQVDVLVGGLGGERDDCARKTVVRKILVHVLLTPFGQLEACWRRHGQITYGYM